MPMLLGNCERKNHGEVINRLITEALEIMISTAVMDECGFEVIRSSLEAAINAGTRVTMVVGGHTGLTDPASVDKASILLDSPGCGFYLARYDRPQVFHSNLYLFRGRNSCTVMVGSASITSSGLGDNMECSLLCDCEEHDSLWLSAVDMFESYKASARKGDPQVREDYSIFHYSQKRQRERINTFIEPRQPGAKVDFSRFKGYYIAFRSSPAEQFEYENRVVNYKKARDVLDSIADDAYLNEQKFTLALNKLVVSRGGTHLWHSGSIHRNKAMVFPKYVEFQALVRQIRSDIASGQPYGITFDNARRLVREVRGAGVNYIAEMMLTYAPDSYPNLNKNPLTVLRKVGGADLRENYELYKGSDYERFREIVLMVVEHFSLRDMLEFDSFCNYIYWR